MFLSLEEGGVHMHVPVLLIFEAAPLRGPGGDLDVGRIRGYISRAIDAAPHFRQRLARVPVLGSPIWTDDERFDIAAHVRHVRLAAPGDDAALKTLVGALSGERLPRERPLWDLTLIEGLAGDRFAALFKVHHVILDGRTGVEALAAIFGLGGAPEPAPRRGPVHPLRLVARELGHRLAAGRDLAAWLGGAVRREGAQVLDQLGRSVAAMLHAAIRPASPTPLNPNRISPRRRVEWRVFDLQAARARKRGGATVNDVLLASVAGMVRTYLRARGHAIEALEVRAAVPVAVERSDGRTNAVVSVFASLPVAVADPAERLRRIAADTRVIKRDHQSDAMDLVGRISDIVSYRLLAEFLKVAIRRRPATLTVSNVVGPPFTLSLLGARLLEVYPFVPINDTQALALAFFSYDGRLFCAFNGDPAAIPDLPAVCDALVAAFAELPAG